MAFETTRIVRLGHTDAARRMYFARQFDLVHEAYEDWLAAEGVPIRTLVENPGGGVPIVHAACDYTAQVFAGDELTIRLTVAKQSPRSFTLAYTLHRGETQVGTAKTVHVAVDATTGRAGTLPEALHQALERHIDI